MKFQALYRAGVSPATHILPFTDRPVVCTFYSLTGYKWFTFLAAIWATIAHSRRTICPSNHAISPWYKHFRYAARWRRQMITSTGAPRPQQNCEPANQTRKSPFFTSLPLYPPLLSGGYSGTIRLGISSKTHFTPSDMSQALKAINCQMLSLLGPRGLRQCTSRRCDCHLRGLFPGHDAYHRLRRFGGLHR